MLFIDIINNFLDKAQSQSIIDNDNIIRYFYMLYF